MCGSTACSTRSISALRFCFYRAICFLLSKTGSRVYSSTDLLLASPYSKQEYTQCLWRSPICLPCVIRWFWLRAGRGGNKDVMRVMLSHVTRIAPRFMHRASRHAHRAPRRVTHLQNRPDDCRRVRRERLSRLHLIAFSGRVRSCRCHTNRKRPRYLCQLAW